MTPTRRFLRITVCLGLLLWICGGPFATQVLHMRWTFVRPWIMFSSASLDVCTVQFTEMHDDGSETPLDRWQALGESGWSKSPGERVLRDAKAIRSQAKRICKHLENGADLRGYARCATRSGWNQELFGETNLCLR